MADWKRAGGFGGKKGGGGDFKRGGFGKPRFGGGGGFKKDFGGQGGRGGEDREMFDAVCSSCGNDCQVPFKPNGSAPVLCRDCFQKQKDSEGGAPRRDSRDDRGFRGGDDRRSEKPRFDTRTSFKDGRPEFTPRGGNAAPDPRVDSLLSEMQGMNAKLEKLVLLVGTMARDGAIASKAEAPATSEVSETKVKKAPKAAAKKKAK
jgi:CxxC-x17-CxxC domain-containing protein